VRTALAALLCVALGLSAVATATARGFDGGTVVGASEAEPIGCTSTPGALVKGAPRPGRAAGPSAAPAAATGASLLGAPPLLPKEVALTFDDGPSRTQTPAILEALVAYGDHATFFEEGRHVAGREALMRQILAAGDEIGNHSFHHPVDPGAAELSSTNEAIRGATGFEPCLFRPPYGEVDPKVTAAARANGLELVLWTLDSEDDHHPGVAAIRRRVVRRTTPGAIVLLHDGGRHPETVEALPGILAGLAARGFRCVTVTELLSRRGRRATVFR
jgi:peptidoglycan/xylan/chitin deacetylase (PgdA/CDA1 family)